MSLSFCSFSSGSSGNCYLVKTESTAVLIDAGISAKRILTELGRTDTPRESVKAVFLTHEHSDHIAGARVLMKRLENAVIFASKGTLDGAVRYEAYKNHSFAKEVPEERCIIIRPNEAIIIGDLTFYAFRTFHDAAEPYGYYVVYKDKRIALMTDTGVVTEEMLEYVADADMLVLESNHDTDMLRAGRYPHYLKQRILGDFGHLSNIQAAAVLLRLFDYHDKKRLVLLAHLSKENNKPALAEQTVLMALARGNRYTGLDLYMGVLLRDEASLLYRF
jgi:phosphoribosyl 1,2-cyclic phosphodiesterase